MSRPKKPVKQRSGGARIVAAGKKPVLLALTPEQHDILRRVADAECRSMTQTVIYHLFPLLKKILEIRPNPLDHSQTIDYS